MTKAQLLTMASELQPWRLELELVFKVGYPVATSHFAATPQSDVVCICAHDFQRHGDAFGTTENACFRVFITLRSEFHYIIVLSELYNGNRVKNHHKPWT